MLALNGQVAGTYTTNNPIPDVGTMQTLDATGTVAPLGNVSAKGTLHAPGFIARGDTEGTLTLTNARGSVTLHLTAAAPQAGFSPPASAYVFTITGGTGAYARAKGSGTASLVETPEQRPAPEPGRPTPDYIVAPMFRLTLRPGGVTA